MCWSSFSKPELKVAENNIPVTKIVKIKQNIIRAYYEDKFVYSVNETYHSKIKLESPYSKVDYYRITEGFHSYKSSCPITLSKSFFCTTLNVGYPNEDGELEQYCMTCNSYRTLGIMSCIIPKGSKYYENEDGEIVSNTIKPIYCYKIK